MRELFRGDAEYAAAKRGANYHLIPEFMHVGVWKVRCAIQGFWEGCVSLDGADFKCSTHVADLAAIRNVIFDPIKRNATRTIPLRT